MPLPKRSIGRSGQQPDNKFCALGVRRHRMSYALVSAENQGISPDRSELALSDEIA
jgi:hypothetical protein